MITLKRYDHSEAAAWDAFVAASRNGTFLHKRAYMDYHADRFRDHSLMFYDDKGLVALLPANEADGILYSHQGLTYGGLLLSSKTHSAAIGEMLSLIAEYLRQEGFSEMVYKVMPTIYHAIPSQDDEYFLWRMGATTKVCNLASVVEYKDGIQSLKAEYCRRNAITRLTKQGVNLNMNADVARYWPLLERHLQQKYGVRPVHTLAEIESLMKNFPYQIRCCAAENSDGEILAGVVMYETGGVAHVQYSTATEQGQRIGAQDFLYMSLINHYASQAGVHYFDFGINNEDNGKILNKTLIRYKEGFGARGVVFKILSLKL